MNPVINLVLQLIVGPEHILVHISSGITLDFSYLESKILGYFLPGVLPGVIKTPLLSAVNVSIRGVNIYWAHHSMMQGGMIFCEIIRKIILPGFQNIWKWPCLIRSLIR